MSNFFVYFCYGSYDLGEVGFAEFNNREDAISFIEDLLKNENAHIDDFVLIEGKCLELQIVEKTIKVEII